MKYIDDLIGKVAHGLFNGVMAVGVGLVYVQMALLALLLLGVSGVLISAVASAVFGG